MTNHTARLTALERQWVRQVPLSWLPKKLVSLWNGDTTRSPVRADTQTSAEKAAKSIPLGEGFTRCEELVQKFWYAAETGEPPRTPAPPPPPRPPRPVPAPVPPAPPRAAPAPVPTAPPPPGYSAPVPPYYPPAPMPPYYPSPAAQHRRLLPPAAAAAAAPLNPEPRTPRARAGRPCARARVPRVAPRSKTACPPGPVRRGGPGNPRTGPAAARRRQGRQGGRSGSETTSPRETRLQENRPTMAAISAGSMDGFCEIYDGMIYV